MQICNFISCVLAPLAIVSSFYLDLSRQAVTNLMTIAETIRSRKQAMSVVEFGEMLGISKYSVYKLIKRGLPAIHLGASIRLDPVQTADWLDQHTTTKIPQRRR